MKLFSRQFSLLMVSNDKSLTLHWNKKKMVKTEKKKIWWQVIMWTIYYSTKLSEIDRA